MKTIPFLLGFGLVVLPFLAQAQEAMGPEQNVAVIAKDGDTWALRCAQNDKGEQGDCEIFQRLIEGSTGQRVAEFAIGVPEKGKAARGVAILPLGVMFDPAVTMQIDGGPSYSFTLRYCTMEGCYAYVDLNDALLANLKSGKEMVFYLTLKDGELVPLVMKLGGFTSAYEKL